MQRVSTPTMLKTRHNILQILKTLHLPVETDNLTLEYAVQQMWPRIAQTLQLTTQEESDKNAESFNKQLQHSEDLALEQTTDDVWVFGYGSLIWKVDFPYIDRRKGYICGYQRRFYQQSIDHRGTHVQPGRVVTLLPTSNLEDRVYGIAYRIAAQQKEKVLQHLDYREKNGYERCALDFHVYPEQLQEQFELIMYIATKDNQSYAGHINRIEDIAMQIFISAGPSGTNREYLFNLANAMRAHFPDVNDEHLFELEEEVLNLIKCNEQCFLKKAVWQQVNAIIEGDKLNSDKAEKAISKLFALCQQRGGKEALLRQVVQLK